MGLVRGAGGYQSRHGSRDGAVVDAYEIPDRIRDTVHLAVPVDCSLPDAAAVERWAHTTRVGL